MRMAGMEMPPEEMPMQGMMGEEMPPPPEEMGDMDAIEPIPGSVVLLFPNGDTYALEIGDIAPEEFLSRIAPQEPLAPELEFTSNDVPLDENRLNFEIGLVKNKKTSKSAVLLPAKTTAQDAIAISRTAKLPVIKEGDGFYLFDPKQITERALRGQIRAGKNGHALGYGTDSVPEGGIPYGIDTDGHASVLPQDIVAMQQSGKLGFSGVAPDREFAISKIKEMGREDANINGLD